MRPLTRPRQRRRSTGTNKRETPPLPVKQPASREEALQTPLSEIEGWLRLTCDPGCAKVVNYPLRLLRQHAGDRKLGDVLPRLKCTVCHRKPARVVLCDDPNDSGLGGTRQTWRVVLIGA